MLYSIDSCCYIDAIPHEREYRIWRSRLSDVEYNAIVAELNQRINGNEIHTASWIPGSDWTGTVYYPIYEKACERDTDLSGRCFGLFLWTVLQQHPDTWAFGRYEKNGMPIRGLTYFKLDNPPRR